MQVTNCLGYFTELCNDCLEYCNEFCKQVIDCSGYCTEFCKQVPDCLENCTCTRYYMKFAGFCYVRNWHFLLLRIWHWIVQAGHWLFRILPLKDTACLGYCTELCKKVPRKLHWTLQTAYWMFKLLLAVLGCHLAPGIALNSQLTIFVPIIANASIVYLF
jgi:hypothetical protein